MKVTVACVGRLRDGPVRELCADYARRLPWTVTWHEVVEDGRLPAGKRQARETMELLARLPDGAPVIALDERGRDLDSAALAERLRTWQDDGHGDLGVLIGGADGLGGDARGRADLVLSFGRLTWPHMLVRAMLMEQLYRAHTILTGHPYHRG